MQILLVSGSLRAGSTNAAALASIAAVGVAGATFELHDGLGALPHFNPDDDGEPLPAEVRRLRRAIAGADAVLFSTPEYAGSLPGSFKNLLDWTIGGGEIYEKPVAWINVAAAPRGAGADESLRTVLAYAGTRIVDEACVRVPVHRGHLDADGAISDAEVRDRLVDVARTLVGAVEGARR